MLVALVVVELLVRRSVCSSGRRGRWMQPLSKSMAWSEEGGTDTIHVAATKVDISHKMSRTFHGTSFILFELNPSNTSVTMVFFRRASNKGSAGPPQSSAPREEEILILYGSQGGTAEKQAETIFHHMPEKLSVDAIQSLTGNDAIEITAVPKLLSLDDFLSEEHGKWRRLAIIVVSSYGSGDAPMNARQFRKKCDGWIQDYQDNKRKPKFLKAMRFALLALGDSYYKTYLKNPTIVQEALTAAGAQLVGERGEADADQGAEEQQKTMSDWTDGIWPHLAAVLVQDAVSEDQLAEMRKHTEAS